MKKLWLAAVTSLMLLGGSIVAFSNPTAPVYTPVIESCATQLWPLDGYSFVIGCIPNGASNCAREICFGDIR